MNITEVIRAELFASADEKYRDFNSSLVPTVPREKMIGVRVPRLRALAKKYAKDERISEFLTELPHFYYDETLLHGYVVSEIKDYDECIRAVERFLPFVDNWAVCDVVSPKSFKSNRAKVKEKAFEWIDGGEEYSIRFGVNALMRYYLGENFDREVIDKVAAIRSQAYYVQTVVAWFFATALAKNYDETVGVLIDRRLDDFTHNKTIRKAVESYRITDERKSFLRSLAIK